MEPFSEQDCVTAQEEEREGACTSWTYCSGVCLLFFPSLLVQLLNGEFQALHQVRVAPLQLYLPLPPPVLSCLDCPGHGHSGTCGCPLAVCVASALSQLSVKTDVLF